MNIEVRRAKATDLESIRKILLLCYERYTETDAWSAEVVEEVKRTRGSQVHVETLIEKQSGFIACVDGEVVGYISINDNEVTKLFVHPQSQKSGVGSALLAQAENTVLESRYETMMLGCAAPSAVPFYEKMGMTIQEERTIDCGPCIGMTSTIMTKELS